MNLERMQAYSADPWELVKDGLIWTTDEADQKSPIKRFPDRPWLRTIAQEWQDHSLLAVPKSRRMMLTWTMIYLHLWMAMFQEGRNVFFISDQLKKSADLVKNAEFIFDHIPEDKMLKPRKKRRLNPPVLEFPGMHSQIIGIAQGASQLRQYTASAIMADEFAFWEKARETFVAMKPCIDGGGKVTIISSANPGFFQDIVFDEVH